ncbi:hypothetical protein ABG067_005712 [Albugo candida]
MISSPTQVEAPSLLGTQSTPDGNGFRVALIYSRQNGQVVDALVRACRGELLLRGVARKDIQEEQVNVPFEMPYVLKQLLQARQGQLDAIICIGCLIRGRSLAFDFVAEAVTRALMKLSVHYKVPVLNGVLDCVDMEQAKSCVGIEGGKVVACNHGIEWAHSAIAMAHFNANLKKKELTCPVSTGSYQQYCQDKTKE